MTLRAGPAMRFREDGSATAVTVTAELDGDAFPEATEVTVTVGDGGDAAVAGTDYESVDGLHDHDRGRLDERRRKLHADPDGRLPG